MKSYNYWFQFLQLIFRLPTMDYSFLLMRHAQSKHNDEKIKWKDEHKQPKFKESEEYKRLKFNPYLIDSNVIMRSQVHDARTLLNLDKIELILCSPLRRCLQTCAELIKGKEEMFRVIVEPLLNSRLSSVWSVGSSANTLKKQYPSFDFKAFQPHEQVWMLKILQNIQKVNMKEMQQNNHRGQDYLLQLLEQKKEESYGQLFLRSRRLKKRICQILQNITFRNINKKEILIISHSCVLNCLLGKEINQKGKIKKKISFEHCNPKKFTSLEVLSQTHCIQPKL